MTSSPADSRAADATVRVALAERAYDVDAGAGLLETAGSRIALKVPRLGRRCAVVSDSNVAPLYAEAVLESLREASFEPSLVTVPAGEASKSMTEAESICRQMIDAGHDRSSFLVALGGGVVGDLAGFAAAIFYRGIPFVQVPTTVLAQVDSSVGGKTGVNTADGKNLLGAFHQPVLVIADTRTLESLPDREFREGFAEIIKHAAIRDGAMLDDLEGLPAARSDLAALIARNVAIKARIVENDERETSGARALLNFGHTIGHAIEAAAGYGRLLHGEAISLGLVAALRLSIRRAGLDPAAARSVVTALRSFDLPTQLEPDIRDDAIRSSLARDKKFREGAIRFVLLRALGDAFVSDAVALSDINEAVAALRTPDPLPA